jgi:predicted transcriptional regulator
MPEVNPPRKLTISEVISEIKDTYIIKDEGVIKLILATVISNRKNKGDKPIWLLLLGGSSSGKTILLQLLRKVGKWVIDVDTLSVNTFASGFGGNDRDNSLLHKANNGILVFKDFTTITSMNEEGLREIMGQMRAIYDGKFDRLLGNGKSVNWEGKVGIIAAGTIDVQRRMRYFSQNGERFLNYIPEIGDSVEIGMRAMRNQKNIAEKEEELARIVGQFINEKLEESYNYLREIPEQVERQMVEVANFCTLARSPVNMNRKNPCIVDYVPEREQPPRMAMMLKNMAVGLMHIDNESHLSHENAKIIYKVGLDSIPVERKLALVMLAKYRSSTTKNLAIRLNYTTDTVRAWLNQLNALKMVDREAGSGKGGDKWVLKQEYKDILIEYLNIEEEDIELEVSDEELKNAYIEEEIEAPEVQLKDDPLAEWD